MAIWTYVVLSADQAEAHKDVESQWLNAMGSEDSEWELASVVPEADGRYRYYFKKELPPPRSPRGFEPTYDFEPDDTLE